jgi:DNA modification methylase
VSSPISIVDASPFFTGFVPFTANAIYPVHRWYRYKEGFSKDLVHFSLGLARRHVRRCLDPFAGSGTTPLACQEVGVPCVSIEVNPFVHHVAIAKLRNSYRATDFSIALRKVQRLATSWSNRNFTVPSMSTITKRKDLSKWLFAPESLQGILCLRSAFAHIRPLYGDLFLVVLASILTDVGNTMKDGKCVRYKRRWQHDRINRQQVIEAFVERAGVFLEDIAGLQKRRYPISNASLCYRSSVTQRLDKIPSESIDAVITSPPYLNSFDYTDVYMPELWALGFVNNYADVRSLRRKTLCSHVQVKWKFQRNELPENICALISGISKKVLWNSTIPEMITGYFVHLQKLLTQLWRVTRPNAHLCFVIGTSSYYNIDIPTDLLLAVMGEKLGFETDEIRVIRPFSKSTQQISANNGKTVATLRESLVVLRKPAK